MANVAQVSERAQTRFESREPGHLRNIQTGHKAAKLSKKAPAFIVLWYELVRYLQGRIAIVYKVQIVFEILTDHEIRQATGTRPVNYT